MANCYPKEWQVQMQRTFIDPRSVVAIKQLRFPMGWTVIVLIRQIDLYIEVQARVVAVAPVDVSAVVVVPKCDQ
jgi:hypothetical protein